MRDQSDGREVATGKRGEIPRPQGRKRRDVFPHLFHASFHVFGVENDVSCDAKAIPIPPVRPDPLSRSACERTLRRIPKSSRRSSGAWGPALLIATIVGTNDMLPGGASRETGAVSPVSGEDHRAGIRHQRTRARTIERRSVGMCKGVCPPTAVIFHTFFRRRSPLQADRWGHTRVLAICGNYPPQALQRYRR